MSEPSLLELKRLLNRDKSLLSPLSLYGPFPGFLNVNSARQSYYQSLVRAIVSQQLSTSAANTIYLNLCSIVKVLTPEQINDLPIETLRSSGLSFNKAQSLKELSLRVLENKINFSSLQKKPDQDVIKDLSEIRGIGPWTAQMFLLFKLGRLDVLPTTDLGIQEGIRILDKMDCRPSPAEVNKRGALWSPLRSVGAWLMWQIANANKDKS